MKLIWNLWGQNLQEDIMGIIALTDGTIKVNDGKVTGGKFVFDLNQITITDLKGMIKKIISEIGLDIYSLTIFF